MKVIDPGHTYELLNYDGDGSQILHFVKRMGEGYPGNDSAYAGTLIQEVLRALIDRMTYVNKQISCDNNTRVLFYLRMALFQLEERAAQRHGKRFRPKAFELEQFEPGANGHLTQFWEDPCQTD